MVLIKFTVLETKNKVMPKKIIKVSEHYIQDNEDWFKRIDFNNPDPIVLAHAFGTWLNMYFEVWAPNRNTWMDSEKHAYTTEELLTEFVNEYSQSL